MEDEKKVVEEEIKTFTQEELNAIVSDRLAREKAKYEGFEELKSKAAKYDELEEANKSEMQKAQEKVASLEAELSSIKKANEVKEMREKVANESGIPANLLTGASEEECKAQAEAIKAYANPTYPNVKDGGEVRNLNKHSTRDQFAEWANQAFLGGN